MRRGWFSESIVTVAVGLLGGGLVVGVGMTVVPSQPIGVEQQSAAAPSWKDSVVRVRSVGCGEVRSGTGVVLGGRLVTNRHVIEDASSIEVVLADGRRLEVTSVATNAGLDLAELGVADWLPGLALAEIDRTVGSVVVGGFATDGAFRTQRGQLTGSLVGSAVSDPRRPTRLGLQVVPGQSGSPVVGDDGRVVGLIYGRADADGSGLVIPASDIARWSPLLRDVPFVTCS